jgi:hypothetical protein
MVAAGLIILAACPGAPYGPPFTPISVPTDFTSGFAGAIDAFTPQASLL